MPPRQISNRPTRRPSNRRQRFTIQVFVEGEKTEPQYVNAWYRLARSKVIVNIDDDSMGYSPYQLVEAAVKHKQQAERDVKKGRGSAPDSYWCVFDVDEHPHLPAAKALAAANGINVAISEPCFELWLLLHYADHRSWQDRHAIQRTLKDATGIGKTLGEAHCAHLLANFDVARARAIALDEMHTENGSSHQNPSSGVWRLIDLIRERMTDHS